MARPKYDNNEITVALRIEEAFWCLLERFSLKEITVNMIVSEAKCTRGSFYYHFADINALTESAIDHNLPAQIPHILISIVLENPTETSVLADDPQLTKQIDRICLLVGSHSSIEVVNKIKARIQTVWLKALELNDQDFTYEANVLFEFLINGIVGVLAYRSRPDVDYDIASILKTMLPLSQTFIKHLMKITQEAPSNTSTPAATTMKVGVAKVANNANNK